MLKKRTAVYCLLLGLLGLLSFTAYQYRNELRDRSLTEYDDTGMFHNILNVGMNDMWQGDTHVVMGKMANETLRAQLGRRTWYLLHVMASRYPEQPTRDEKDAMKNFLFLMSRLYPCGDCAHHFQQHLKKHPPIVGSRNDLEQYLCNMHNVVNRSELPVVLPNDVPPPYSLFEHETNTCESESHAFDAASFSELEPTGLVTAVRGKAVVIQQRLVASQSSLLLELQNISACSVTISANANPNYLFGITAKFMFRDNVDMVSAMEGLSQTDPKTNTTLMRLGMKSVQLGELASLECHVVLPTVACMDKVQLQLPANAHLNACGITKCMLRHLDIAAIDGKMELKQIETQHIRVAIAKGAIDAKDIFAKEAAEFIAISGRVHIDRCNVEKTARFNIPSAQLFIHNLHAQTAKIQGSQANILVDNCITKAMHVNSKHGMITLNAIKADSISVQSETASIRGHWYVSKLLDISASSAIVQGKADVAQEARVSVKTANWPIQLSVNRDYQGSFTVKAFNGLANFGLDNATFYNKTLDTAHGVVGIGGSRLEVQNRNSPVVISSH
ncbi:hypothetical protein IWW40_001179 [Coemansia sp. RSA 1250]|nr:hypothetical protein IWW40_001179 [Coemansia sp. RSA 1250]